MRRGPRVRGRRVSTLERQDLPAGVRAAMTIAVSERVSGMTEAELIAAHPRLYHMAEDGAWPAIRERGLLSTSALLDLYGVAAADRAALETRRRAKSVTLEAPGLPRVVIRDQAPLSEARLAACLDDGLNPEDWLRLLNKRVFFWPRRRRLEELLAGRAYRGRAHTVLTIDTASLLAAYGKRVRLSAINSGATIYDAPRRGLSTFRATSDYPLREAGRRKAIAEFTVEYSIPDIAEHVVEVERAVAGQFERMGSPER